MKKIKINKNFFSKMMFSHLTTEKNYTDRMKSGISQLNLKKIGKEVHRNKTLISPKKINKRTKTAIFGKKDFFLFGQKNDVISSCNYNKSINGQILKNINLINSNRPHKEMSLINKRKINSYQFGIDSSRIEKDKKRIKHLYTNSQNITVKNLLNKLNPLPLKEIIKKGPYFFF
jgi:hypothetical protein